MANNLSSLDHEQVIRSAYDEQSNSFSYNNVADLVKEAYDYIALTYVTSGNGTGEIETVTYKNGGAGGTTVAVLTLTYDGSDRIASITVS